MNSSAAMRDKSVGYWLLAIALLIALMVLVGGLTRLTGSGLSITEWRPVTGAVPPLSENDWQAEFAKYRASPQYRLLNEGMSLAQFQTIYWWEWAHRFLGRLVGFVFLIPFVYFLWHGRIGRQLGLRLAGIFALGGAQGALGWWMVRSGLEAERVAVSQYRLAAHLGLAVVLLGLVLWTAFEAFAVKRTADARLARFQTHAWVLAALVFLQMLLGALMAGLDAGLAFVDFPGYAGALVPPGLYDLAPWWINHFENHALVHFQHRNAGYLIAILSVALFVMLKRNGADKPVRIAGAHVFGFAVLQVLLGIATILSAVALPLAALHQILALALFGASLWLAYTLQNPVSSRS